MPGSTDGHSSFARYRLFGFTFEAHGDDDHAYSVEVVDLSPMHPDVTKAVTDADYYYTDQGKLWALAAVSGNAQADHLTWLSGYDYRFAPRSYLERRARRDMQLRYLMAQSRLERPIVLPDGLRLIRMFPEWGGAGPLWESFTENYPAQPSALGLDEDLAADLQAWNDGFGTDDEEASTQWLAQGRVLHARVAEALEPIAEVSAEFLS